MNYLQLLTELKTFYQNGKNNRADVLAFQDQKFRALLKHTWQQSKFYRLYYSDHGITESDLSDVQLHELPMTDKAILMDNFNDVVTDKSLKNDILQEWIQQGFTTGEMYDNEFVIVHTSGSSGTLGIYPYRKSEWLTFNAALMLRVLGSDLNLLTKTKVVFYGVVDGQYTGATLAAKAPRLWFDIKQMSVLTELSENVAALNQYQPKVLAGYASTIAELAEAAVKQNLAISPSRIMVSGDPLTAAHRAMITNAWPSATLIELYASTECPCVALRVDSAESMQVYDDLLMLEILKDNQYEANVGERGQMAFTNLHNLTFPLIRYQMSDWGAKAPISTEHPFSAIYAVEGRKLDELPIKCLNGQETTLHPLVLCEFFVSGLDKVQFVSRAADRITVRYVGTDGLQDEIKTEFLSLLAEKNADKTVNVDVERVEAIKNDPSTGKYRMIDAA